MGSLRRRRPPSPGSARVGKAGAPLSLSLIGDPGRRRGGSIYTARVFCGLVFRTTQQPAPRARHREHTRSQNTRQKGPKRVDNDPRRLKSRLYGGKHERMRLMRGGVWVSPHHKGQKAQMAQRTFFDEMDDRRFFTTRVFVTVTSGLSSVFRNGRQRQVFCLHHRLVVLSTSGKKGAMGSLRRHRPPSPGSDVVHRHPTNTVFTH